MRSYKVIISKSSIFNDDDFPCLSDKSREKIGNDDFIIIEINLNRETFNDQAQFEVEPQEESQNVSDVEILEDD